MAVSNSAEGRFEPGRCLPDTRNFVITFQLARRRIDHQLPLAPDGVADAGADVDQEGIAELPELCLG